MKLLLIAWHFPPHNNIAAVRIGKLARYFWQQGHDIRVLTPRKQDTDTSEKQKM